MKKEALKRVNETMEKSNKIYQAIKQAKKPYLKVR